MVDETLYRDGVRHTRGASGPVRVTVTLGLSSPSIMPKIRTSRTKQPPEGFEDIESVGPCFTRVVFLGAETNYE